MFVEVAAGRRTVQVVCENDPQNEWNNTSTQLNATFTLYQKEKKWCCPISSEKVCCEILSTQSILEGIFGIRNIDKIIRKGFFFCHERIVDKRIITL